MSLRSKVKAEAPEKVRKLCQSCPTGEGVVLCRGRLMCQNCYELHRESRTLDAIRGDILSAHPEWRKRNGEASKDYAQRMAQTCHELLTGVTERVVPRG